MMKRYQVILIVAAVVFVSLEVTFRSKEIRLASTNGLDSSFTTRLLRSHEVVKTPGVLDKIWIWLKILWLKLTRMYEKYELQSEHKYKVALLKADHEKEVNSVKGSTEAGTSVYKQRIAVRLVFSLSSIKHTLRVW
ncbi:hypothetical protein Plhal304r1_c012g0045981 [Plasmopara halstedii]